MGIFTNTLCTTKFKQLTTKSKLNHLDLGRSSNTKLLGKDLPKIAQRSNKVDNVKISKPLQEQENEEEMISMEYMKINVFGLFE